MKEIKTAKDGRQYTVINGKAVFIKGSKPVVKAVVEMASAPAPADTKGIACGNCSGKHSTVQEVRACFGVTVVNTKWTARPTAVINDLDKKFMVTCGWGKASHKVEMTKAEAIAFRNTCKQHRS